MQVHHDLASLVFEAEAVVVARRTGERRVAPGLTLVEHRVEEVCSGPLQPGDVVEVSYDDLAMKPARGWPGADAGPPVVSDEVVLFLVPAAAHDDFPPDAGPPPRWRLIDGGLRIFAGGLAYRFEEPESPGPREPRAQRAEPFDAMGDPRAGAQLDRPALIAAIRAALAHAREVRAAIAARGSPEGRRALVAAVGPPVGVDDAPVTVSPVDGFFWDDSVARSALEALASSGDLDALLEGVARVRGGVFLFRVRHGVPPARLLDVAEARGAPLHLRLAALTLLAGRGFGYRDAPSAARLPALFDDAEPEVRAAAITLQMSRIPAPEGLAEAVAARWPRETDPRVKLALLEAADRVNVMDRIAAWGTLGDPVVWAERRGRIVDVTWRNPGDVRQRLVHLTVTARAAGRTVATLDLAPPYLSGWSSGSTAGEHAFLGFDPPLAPGVYDLAARVDLEGERGKVVSLTFTLRPLRTGLASAPAEPSPTFSLPGAAPPPEPPRRSCACSLPGDGGAEGGLGALAALAAMACAVVAAITPRGRSSPRTRPRRRGRGRPR